MLKQQHHQRESSPIAQDIPMSTLSPNSKRRAEFTIKHLQSGVMGRARSTLNTLGDVWRPKVNAGASSKAGATLTKNSATTSTTGKKWAAVWASRSKKPTATPIATPIVDENSTVAANTSKTPNPLMEIISERNNVLIDNSNRNKNLLIPTDMKAFQPATEVVAETPHRQRRSNNIAINHPKQYLRNSSLDLALLLASHQMICDNDISDDGLHISEMTDMPLSRSSNDNYLQHRNRRNSFVDAWEPVIQTFDQPPVKASESVIKAKMRLQKLVVSGDDAHESDMVVRRTHCSTKPGILFRHSSVEPIGSGKFLSTSRQSGSEEYSASDEQDDENNLIVRQRPRKKLSFREPPVVGGAKFVNLKSDTLPRAKKFLEEYEEKRSGSLDYELESQAMRIVRTVGQAFEVCHKFNLQKNSLDHNADDHSDTPCELSDRCSDHISDEEDEPKKDPIPATPEPPIKRPNQLDIMPVSNYNFRKSSSETDEKSPTVQPQQPHLSSSKEMQKMRDSLEQQTLQTRQALAQLMLVREQLITETNARIEAQARTQQLLQQNRELLEHLASMGGYNESDRPGLTTATIGLAQQSLMPSDSNDSGSPVRKNFQVSSPNNNSVVAAATQNNSNNMSTINQHLNNLGSINQQLNTLSQQLCGLNQQSQNLQNFQNMSGGGSSGTASSATSFGQLHSLTGISVSQQPCADNLIQHDLFQSNQELLNRLQSLSLGYSNNNSITSYSPSNSYVYSNAAISSSATPNNNNNNHQHLTNNNNHGLNLQLLSSPSSIGNLTPSPILNRNSFSASPSLFEDSSLGLSMERNLDRLHDHHQFIRPLSQVSTMTTMDSDGRVKVVVPIAPKGSLDDAGSTHYKKPEKKVTIPEFVTLKVTDESGNITNQRKLSATPSFITRSTSEKVPNRSQIMSEVQRTTWARHTTK